MKKEDIYSKYIEICPFLKPDSYKKVGSRCISIKIGDKNLLFMYNNKDDWSIGTKIWRSKP